MKKRLILRKKHTIGPMRNQNVAKAVTGLRYERNRRDVAVKAFDQSAAEAEQFIRERRRDAIPTLDNDEDALGLGHVGRLCLNNAGFLQSKPLSCSRRARFAASCWGVPPWINSHD